MERKVYIMQNLGCANCAAKMEAAIKKIEGVSDCSVNFFAQKLVLDADDTRFDEIVKLCDKAIRRVDPDCRLIVK